jgi:hypothetical protein
MLLPVHAALGTRAPLSPFSIAIATRTAEFWAIVATSRETVSVANPELAILEAPRRTRLVPVTAWRTVIPITTGRAVVTIEALGSTLAPLKATRRSVAVATAERTLLAVTPEARLVAIGFAPLRPKAALGELLLGASRLAGAALSAIRTFTPAARGIIVFVVVAGHERSHLRGRTTATRARQRRRSCKTEIHFC